MDGFNALPEVYPRQCFHFDARVNSMTQLDGRANLMAKSYNDENGVAPLRFSRLELGLVNGLRIL